MSNGVAAKAQTAMDKLSKKMGVTGALLGYIFYISTAPELLRIKLSVIIVLLYIFAQKIDDCIAIWRNPKRISARSFMGRMSKTLTVTSGFLAGLFVSNFSPDLKLWAGFAVVCAFLVMQAIYDGILAYYGMVNKHVLQIPPTQ